MRVTVAVVALAVAAVWLPAWASALAAIRRPAPQLSPGRHGRDH